MDDWHRFLKVHTSCFVYPGASVNPLSPKFFGRVAGGVAD